MLTQSGIRYFRAADLLGIYLLRTLTRHATEFIGIQETRQLLTPLEKEYPDLVKEVQKTLSLQKVNEILRRLVSENISIANLRLILEALAKWIPREQDIVLLTEYVRMAMARQICFRWADRNRLIPAYLLERHLEEAVRRSVRPTTVGTFLAVPEDIAHPIAEQVWQKLQKTQSPLPPVIMTAMDIRRHVRNLLFQNGIEVPVMSFQELSPEFSVQTLGTIQSRRVTEEQVETRLLT